MTFPSQAVDGGWRHRHHVPENGSGSWLLTHVMKGTGFGSRCVEPMLSIAVCTCRDDWDRPHMRCEAGACTGRPDPATCLLASVPFSESLPQVEIARGGADQDSSADVPYGRSTQSVDTPVANLDDDNGDGRIDVGTFPKSYLTSIVQTSQQWHPKSRMVGARIKRKIYLRYWDRKPGAEVTRSRPGTGRLRKRRVGLDCEPCRGGSGPDWRK